MNAALRAFCCLLPVLTACGGSSHPAEDAGSPPEDGNTDGEIVDQAAPPDDRTIGPDTVPGRSYFDQCAAPANPDQPCSEEGSVTCGRVRSCTDIASPFFTDCVCRAGRYDCGPFTCAPCSFDLRSGGCGIGQTCTGVTFRLCDGGTTFVPGNCFCDANNPRAMNCGSAGRFAFGCAGGADAAGLSAVAP